MPDATLSRYIEACWWRIRFGWVFRPWARRAYLDGYCMGWNDHKVMPDYHNPDSAWNEWVSRLGDKY